MAATGTVYLLHFQDTNGQTARYQHAGHYLGYTTDLDSRLEAHRAGQGARLMEVVKDAGLGFQLARTWKGDRRVERRLKNRHSSPRLCPLCHHSGKEA